MIYAIDIKRQSWQTKLYERITHNEKFDYPHSKTYYPHSKTSNSLHGTLQEIWSLETNEIVTKSMVFVSDSLGDEK